MFYYQFLGTVIGIPANEWEYAYEPMYFRIANFGSPGAIVPLNLGLGFSIRDNESMGEYDGMVSVGNDLYIPHVQKDVVGTGTDTAWNVYLAHVTACPPATDVQADVNADTVVGIPDASLFTSWYAAGDPRADLNHNGVVDVADVTLFLASYACGCNP